MNKNKPMTERTSQLISKCWSLICPNCQHPIEVEESICHCGNCNQSYPVVDGVIRFVSEDKFYENRYAPKSLDFNPNDDTLWGKTLLYLVSMHYFWYIYQYIPENGKILDVASGAGMHYLVTRGTIAGLEISVTAGREMAKIYDLALQADALRIPLADASIDGVVSRFFLEHVPPDDKAKLLAEFFRVLKPGGWLITLQDCECNNPLWQWARQDDDLFQDRFIENDGHYGLMYASENLALFKQIGFKVIKYYASNKTPIVSLSMIQWLQPYKEKSWWAKLFLPIGSGLARNRWLNTLYTFAMTLLDDIVEPFLPIDHGRYLLAACRKDSIPHSDD